jgi:hypothetical protein
VSRRVGRALGSGKTKTENFRSDFYQSPAPIALLSLRSHFARLLRVEAPMRPYLEAAS